MVDISGYRSWCRSSGMSSWYLYVYPVQTIQENCCIIRLKGHDSKVNLRIIKDQNVLKLILSLMLNGKIKR
jgi:hypothetical protein